MFEPRQLLSTGGFVQGFALTNSSTPTPVSGATVELLTTSNEFVASTTTNSSGYYGFNNVAPGTYNVMEVALGYTTSVNGSDIQTTINPASAINGNTEIQVTVEDLTTQNLGLQWTGGLTGGSVDETLIASSYNQAGTFSGVSQEGQLQLQFVSPPGNPNPGNVGAAPNEFSSFCSDLLHGVYANAPFTVQPSLTPNTTTLYNNTIGYDYSVNLGEIGYLYNTYGTTAQASVNASALQLAFWALEYNQMPTSGPMTLQSPNSPFQVNMSATDPIVTAANSYLSEAYAAERNGNSQDAYFLNLNTTAEQEPDANLGQGMFSTDLLNFTNTAIPAINTSQQPATAAVGTSIADTATVSGGDNPTGTVTFNLYNNSTGTGTPLYTDANVPLSSGTATATGYIATATGTDYWVATYNGDSNNAAVSSGTASEPVTITPATPAIDTSQQPASATVGTSIADQATVSGGDNATGTVTFYLYNNSSGTGTPLYTDASVPLVSGVASSTGYTAAPGTDYWVATYSGDSNNVSVTSGTAGEPVTITPATPAIDTSQQPASATVGTSIADQATVSGGDSPTGTVTFYLYNNSSGTGTPLFTDANVPLVSGVATSAGYTAAAPGTDYWVAAYSGDSNNVSVTSGTATVVVVAPAATALSPAPNIPPVPSPLFTTLAFFNSSTSKAITTSASNQPATGPTLYVPNPAQGLVSIKSPSGKGREGPQGGRSLQEILALLLGNSSPSAGGNRSNLHSSFASQMASSGFSPSSTSSDGAITSLGPDQSPAISPQEMAQNELQLTGGKSTRILMLTVWTLSLRNQRQRRLGRRSRGEKAIRLK